jgi:hypothetical protein
LKSSSSRPRTCVDYQNRSVSLRGQIIFWEWTESLLEFIHPYSLGIVSSIEQQAPPINFSPRTCLESARGKGFVQASAWEKMRSMGLFRKRSIWATGLASAEASENYTLCAAQKEIEFFNCVHVLSAETCSNNHSASAVFKELKLQSDWWLHLLDKHHQLRNCTTAAMLSSLLA